VLIHFGVSAYSGHYVAHIRDKKVCLQFHNNHENLSLMRGASIFPSSLLFFLLKKNFFLVCGGLHCVF